MPIPMQAARFATGEVPDCTNLAAASATNFKKGTTLARVGATVQPHALGATVTGIYGIAQGGATAGVGDAIDHTVNVAKAGRAVEFMSPLYNSNTAAFVTVSKTLHLGNKYGIVRVGQTDYVNVFDTTNVVVEVTDVKEDLNVVLFKFLESAIQGA